MASEGVIGCRFNSTGHRKWPFKIGGIALSASGIVMVVPFSNRRSNGLQIASYIDMMSA
jgi:hypothetical protein